MGLEQAAASAVQTVNASGAGDGLAGLVGSATLLRRRLSRDRTGPK